MRTYWQLSKIRTVTHQFFLYSAACESLMIALYNTPIYSQSVTSAINDIQINHLKAEQSQDFNNISFFHFLNGKAILSDNPRQIFLVDGAIWANKP